MSNEATKKLTLDAVFKDFFWLPLLLAFCVGAPSLLTILQDVTGHKLVPALQWIVEDYKIFLSAIGSIFEPFIVALVGWLNGVFGWKFTVNPVWKPVLLLISVVPISQFRVYGIHNFGSIAFWVNIIVYVFFVLLSALEPQPHVANYFSLMIGEAFAALALTLGVAVTIGLRHKSVRLLRVSIVMMSGFFVAGIVLAANWVLLQMGA